MALIFLCHGASAATYYVSQTNTNEYQIGVDTNNGTAKTTPFLTLGKVRSVITASDTVYVNDGTYLTTDGANGATALVISSGTWLPQTQLGATIRSASAEVVAFTPVASETITLGAFIVDAQGNVGAIHMRNAGTTPTIILSGTKTTNFATYGYYSDKATYNLSILNCIIQNSASSGTSGISDNNHSSGNLVIDGAALAMTSTSSASMVGISVGNTGASTASVSIKNVTGTLSTPSSALLMFIKTTNIPNALVDSCNVSIIGSTTVVDHIGIGIMSSGSQSDGGIIRNNTVSIDASAGLAILIGDTTAAPGTYANKCNNGKIYNNTVTGTPNRLTGTPHGVALMKNTGGQMYNNFASDFSPNFYAELTDATTIVHHNVALRSYGGQAIYAKGAIGTQFYNNTIYSSSNGVAFAQRKSPITTGTPATGCIWKNNIAYQTGSSPSFVVVDSDCTGTFENNLYYSTQPLVSSSWSYQGNNYGTFTAWQGTGFDAHGINSNPLFISSSDFHLQNTSPAINAGTDVGLTADYAGNPVPSGPFPDIGAYEFQDSTAPTTTADVDTGLYNSAQSVTLTCSDGSGVGCDKIYYTTDGTDPTTGSAQYSTPIAISSTATLKFFSRDRNENSETPIKSKIYTIDTTASTISNIIPQGMNYPAGTDSATLSFATNENATCKYSTSANQNYSDMPDTFQTTGGQNHSTQISNLQDGQSYQYYVKCQDTAGNANQSDHELSFSISSSDFIPILAIGNSKIYRLSPDISLAVRSKYVVFRGKISSLTNGRVELYQDGKLKKSDKINKHSKWRIRINERRRSATHTYQFKYYDQNIQLVETSQNYTVIIDREKPRFTYLPKLTKVNPGDTITWQVSDNDQIKSYQYTFRGRKVTTSDNFFIFPASLPKGQSNLAVRAYDRAGNKAVRRAKVKVQ